MQRQTRATDRLSRKAATGSSVMGNGLTKNSSSPNTSQQGLYLMITIKWLKPFPLFFTKSEPSSKPKSREPRHICLLPAQRYVEHKQKSVPPSSLLVSGQDCGVPGLLGLLVEALGEEMTSPWILRC